MTQLIRPQRFVQGAAPRVQFVALYLFRPICGGSYE